MKGPQFIRIKVPLGQGHIKKEKNSTSTNYMGVHTGITLGLQGEEVCIRHLTISGKGHHSLFEVISPPSATMFHPRSHPAHSTQQLPSLMLCTSHSELTSHLGKPDQPPMSCTS